MKFAKPSLSIPDQIALLERRGMAIGDQDRAAHYLRHISYYRLRAYWLPFEIDAAQNGDHAFCTGASFDQAIELYVFDRLLRLHVMDAIERIEVSIRAVWAHHMAMTYGPHGFINAEHYHRADFHARSLTGLMDEVGRSRDTFIEHYRSKYSEPDVPPIWMAAEVMSLGQLSKWLSNLKRRSDRKAIATHYGLDEIILGSLAHHLAHVRNICAHHARLWNKQFTVTMKLPREPKTLSEVMNHNAQRRLYNTLATIAYLIERIAPGSDWRRNLVTLIGEHPLADPKAMGFPKDWETMDAWRAAS
jgi:abortive infection bacteriophage resistance protein